MAIKRLVTEKQAKENALELLHKKLARDKVMGRSTTDLVAKIKKLENA